MANFVKILTMNRDLSGMRKDYTAGTLDEKTVDRDPIAQFRLWFDEALNSTVVEPNAMVLATCTNNKPSTRVVLLKGFDHNGFIFFTNYHSRKGHELAQNPNASLLFFWDRLERQVRIEGRIEKVIPEISSAYFNSRPRDSRIGAVASPQSQRVSNREQLEEKVDNVTNQFANETEIPRPDNWGGYMLVPDKIEFWQGRSNRLHDRVVFEKTATDWDIYRIAP